MPAPRTLRRTLAAFAITGAVVAAALLPASSAFAADDVTVSISGFNSTQTADRQDNFQVSLRNRTNKAIENLRVTLTVHLDGLSADAVRITRGFTQLGGSGNGSDVSFSDPEPLPRLSGGRSASRGYIITFLGNAPSGKAELTVTASDGNGELGSATRETNVKAGAASSASPSAKPTSSASTYAVPIPSNTVSIGALGGGGQTLPASDSGGGVPVILYIMGGILVAMGGAILWVLFRRPSEDRERVEAALVDPTRPATLGYPVAPRHSAPTAMLPVVSEAGTTATLPRRRGQGGPGGPGATGPVGPGGPGFGPGYGGPAPMGNPGPGGGPGYGRPGPQDRTTAFNPRLGDRPGPAADPWADSSVDDTMPRPGGPGPRH